ncbi:MAG: GerMN domain-containing protein [Clostridia bacterium]|nr:GerMN domain-containing protein [Clostridia bacterium]
MRRKTLLTIMLGSMLLLTGCLARKDPLPETTLIPGTEVTLPTVSEERVREHREATLWFRFLDEPYLAPETRTVTQLSSQPYEMALLTALFSGPGTQHTELVSLFPDGARPLSTIRQGRRLLVTVSSEFGNPLSDEPADWRRDPLWRDEVPLRRALCMQSIVATVTENCDVDEVVILVEQRDVISESMRLRQSWFMADEEDDGIAPAQVREDEYLLTAGATADAVMTCWERRDWARLYNYISAVDSFTGVTKPEYRDFVAQMESVPKLTGFIVHDAYVRGGGDVATVTASVRLRKDTDAEISLDSRCLRLTREDGIWKIGMSGMLGWMEE